MKRVRYIEQIRDPDVKKAAEAVFDVLPRRLRALRECQGLRLYDIAEEVGIQWQAISAYERGEYIPSVDRLAALAAFFGVTVDDLIWEEGV